MKHRRFHGSSAMIALVLLTATACAYGSGTIRETKRAESIEGAVHLNVNNRTNGPMEVHAAARGTSYRLGTVLPGLSGHATGNPQPRRYDEHENEHERGRN